jgi:hypothetical protein
MFFSSLQKYLERILRKPICGPDLKCGTSGIVRIDGPSAGRFWSSCVLLRKQEVGNDIYPLR